MYKATDHLFGLGWKINIPGLSELQFVLLGCLNSDLQTIFTFLHQTFFREFSHFRTNNFFDFTSVYENFCDVGYHVSCFQYICSLVIPLGCRPKRIEFIVLFPVLCFRVQSEAFPQISIPMGCTQATKQDASYEMVLYAFPILMLIILFMSVCVYVFMNMYICTYVCAYVHMYICIYVCVCIFMFVRMCVCMYVCKNISASIGRIP